MKKSVFYIVLVGILLSSYSCSIRDNCNGLIYVPPTELIQRYFGNYKPGAYWIYANKDSTLTDSIWADDFDTQRIINQDKCEEYKSISFNLNSTYFYNYINLNDKHFNHYSKVERLTISNNVVKINDYIFCEAYNGDKDFDASGKSILIKKLYDYKLSQHLILDTVFLIDRIIIAPKFGIVQYFPTNSQDTFSLIDFKKM